MSRSRNTIPAKFRDHESWEWRWGWLRHAPASFRRFLNRERRSKANQAVHEGKEPPRERKDAAWKYW